MPKNLRYFMVTQPAGSAVVGDIRVFPADSSVARDYDDALVPYLAEVYPFPIDDLPTVTEDSYAVIVADNWTFDGYPTDRDMRAVVAAYLAGKRGGYVLSTELNTVITDVVLNDGTKYPLARRIEEGWQLYGKDGRSRGITYNPSIHRFTPVVKKEN